ncbi:beta-glucosidase [Microbacterium sp. NPDC055683]
MTVISPTIADDAATLTTGADYWTTTAAPRFGLRALRLADGPHGLRVQDDENPDHLGIERSAPATCFPPAVTLASSWDPDLVTEVATALGREARAAGVDVVLGPGMNIKRSPLCGRNFEYFSEDPLLTGVLAGAVVRGLQSQGVAACVKHFAVNNQETDRHRVSAEIDERPLREIYLRAFQIALEESTPWALMSSYNRINGVHASENTHLLTTVLREEWGYDGVVVSDWGGVHDPVAAVAAGLDLRMPGRPEDPRVREAVSDGRLAPAQVERVVERLRLLADRTETDAPAEPINADEHHALARRAAARSAVLLTNDGTLPLDPVRTPRIAIIGALAEQPRYQGGGSSHVNPTRVSTGLDELTGRLRARGGVVEYAPGYSLDARDSPPAVIDEALAVARRADVVVLFLGLPDAYEAEGRDRTSIDLPADQRALIEALREVPAQKAVVLSNGSAVTTAGWREHVGAIAEFWLTGQAHGEAVADVILGDVDPGGRLTETIPLRLEDTPAFLDFPGEGGAVGYGEGVFVGYRSYEARGIAVDHPFGHGLSYTAFEYRDLVVSPHDRDDVLAFTAEVTIANTGARRGSDVVQLYVTDHGARVRTPPRELRGWRRVELAAGEETRVRISVRKDRLAHWNRAAGAWSFDGGALDVLVGASSRDLRLEQSIEIEGEGAEIPLSLSSTLGDFLAHPVIGPRLSSVAERRGGFRGRIGDLLGDPAGRINVLGITLQTLVEFPGVPLDAEDLDGFIRDQHSE